MISRPRWTKNILIFGGSAIWGLLLISCVVASRAVVAPPKIAGADFVGSKECAQCHEDTGKHFGSSTHAKVAVADPKLGDTSCEACHGPGSLHVKAGGSKGTIINPDKSPETCYQCHLDKRAEFNLPNSHPVNSGHVTCTDCHNPHEGDAIKGAGAAMEAMNESCTKCHSAQRGPFVYEHGAMKDGCVSCHNPHGSVNQKMLVARDANLCLQCHLEAPAIHGAGQINANSHVSGLANHNTRLMAGTCWVAGCHEAVHGSNANTHTRR
jgi:predicted CXXCH cytochrome family protein